MANLCADSIVGSNGGHIGGEAARLAELLRGIYRGAPDFTEARVLGRHLVGTAWASAPRHAAATAIDEMEFVLAGAAKLAMREDMFKVSDVKAWLRSFGADGGQLAAEISKLSKPRNRLAHPRGPQLLARMALLVNAAGSESAGDAAEVTAARAMSDTAYETFDISSEVGTEGMSEPELGCEHELGNKTGGQQVRTLWADIVESDNDSAALALPLDELPTACKDGFTTDGDLAVKQHMDVGLVAIPAASLDDLELGGGSVAVPRADLNVNAERAEGWSVHKAKRKKKQERNKPVSITNSQKFVETVAEAVATDDVTAGELVPLGLADADGDGIDEDVPENRLACKAPIATVQDKLSALLAINAYYGDMNVKAFEIDIVEGRFEVIALYAGGWNKRSATLLREAIRGRLADSADFEVWGEEWSPKCCSEG